jgi:hypothetical protein
VVCYLKRASGYMVRLGQTWQGTKGHWLSCFVVPSAVIVISFIILLVSSGCEAMMNEIMFWLSPIIAGLIVFLAIFFWHFFRDPIVYVKAEVKKVQGYTYYLRVSSGYSEDDKKVLIEATLNPTKPVRVDTINLKISGELISVLEFSPEEISEAKMYHLEFHVPSRFAVGVSKAQIVAFANNIKRSSKPFIINFGEDDDNGQKDRPSKAGS